MTRARRDPSLWGVEAELLPLAGGHRNTVFRASRVDAAPIVFKSTRRSEASLAWLLPVLAAARKAGFVVPEPIPSRRGRLAEQGWTCEPLVAGQPFTAALMPSIKEPLARFHAATEGMAQRPGFASSLDLLHVDSGGDVDLDAMPAEVATVCRTAWSALAPAPLVAVQGDLFAENLIMTAMGAPALIDWDEARVDLAAFDLATVAGEAMPAVVRRARIAWEIACSWQLEPAYARRLLAEKFRT